MGGRRAGPVDGSVPFGRGCCEEQESWPCRRVGAPWQGALVLL